jgi:hypothetical protein
VFEGDEFCQVSAETMDADATGALHIVSLYDPSGAGVWYANNTAGEFRAQQLRQPKVFTDDGPRGVSAIDVDDVGRPHIVFQVWEAGTYDDETEGNPEDDGLWYAIGPAGWREPAAYSFTLDSQCGERLLIGQFHVEVLNGEVVRVDALEGYTGPLPVPPNAVPTLQEILTLAVEARRRGASEVSVVLDPTDGHPVAMNIDGRANTIDDEECYTISEYVRADD